MGIFSWLFGDSNDENQAGGIKGNNNEYFTLLNHIKDWQYKKQYNKMLKCCDKTIPLLERFVSNYKKEFGSFDISSIPAIEVGCRYWAALNDKDALNRVKTTIMNVPELDEGWKEVVNSALEDAALSVKLQEFLKENPGFHQNQLGKALDTSGHFTSRLVTTLSNLGKVKRTKSGKTYELYLVIDN